MDRIVVQVDRGLRIHRACLRAGRLRSLRAQFSYPNPDFYKRQRMGLWVGNVARQITTYEEQGDWLILPRGATRKLRQWCAEKGLEPEFWDQRHMVDPVDFLPEPGAEAIELRPDQERLLQSILGTENCLIRAATGSGKTEVGVELIRRLRQPAVVVVWEGGLLEQWVERICRRWGWRESSVGVLGKGRQRIRPVTVAMQQSLVRRADGLADRFGLLIADEVQRWGARSFRELIGRFPARYRVGLSADERRKDRLEVLIHDAFGEVVDAVEKEELIAQGRLCEVEVVVVPTEVEMPELDQGPREERGQRVGRMWKRILDRLTADDARTATICRLAAQQAADGHSVLIFTDRVDHAREISRRLTLGGTPCGLMLGGPENEALFRETRERLNQGRLRVAVGTSKIDQGIDIPRLDVGIAATPSAGNQQRLEQQVGRLRRTFPGKERGRLYYVWDHHLFRSHLDNLRRWYGDLVTVQD